MAYRTLVLPLAFAFLNAAPAIAQTSAPQTKVKQEDTIARATPKSEFLPGTFTQVKTDHVIGDKNAPSTLIIYASVTCPHCAHWFETVWPDLKKNYIEKGTLKVIFREYPTAPAQLAVAGFQLANCGPEDQYFNMIEYLMAEQTNTFEAVKAGKGLEVFLTHAKKAGIKNEADMNVCFNNEKGMQRIQQVQKLSLSGKISGVPSFVLNGKPFEHGSDYSILTQHIDGLK